MFAMTASAVAWWLRSLNPIITSITSGWNVVTSPPMFGTW